MLEMLMVAVGGFAGAICRYAISRFFQKRSNRPFPLGTFLVNLLGSFLLGLMFGANIKGYTYALFGTGFMGAFTTFSTFNLELVRLQEYNNRFVFYLYLLLTYVIGIGFAFLGYYLGTSV